LNRVATGDEIVKFDADGRQLSGTLIAPAIKAPGVSFVHGWGGNQEQYFTRAAEIAALGCMCLTFDLRGNEPSDPEHETVTREHNLRDIIAAYELLSSRPNVDRSAIGVVASSYGAYLAAIVTSLRPVKWLALRAPALYKDEDWEIPKQQLKSEELAAYRRSSLSTPENRALAACAKFEGDALIVECERDDVVPHPVITNYRAAFESVNSLTYRILKGADHRLSEDRWQQAYTSILVNWATEMVVGARESGSTPRAHTRLRPSPQRGPSTPA
jgi:pimeloyl-ACP methyl ester carboxylesterase